MTVDKKQGLSNSTEAALRTQSGDEKRERLNFLSAPNFLLTENETTPNSQATPNSDNVSNTRSCCCFTLDMAGDGQRAEKYIIDIPFSVLWSIVQSLDADKGWEALAAEAGYTFDKIRLLELEGARTQGSPTKSLLWELGSRNHTVRKLYGMLNNIRRFREMKTLEDYVNSAAPAQSTSMSDSGLKGLNSSDSLKYSSKKEFNCNSDVCSDNINFLPTQTANNSAQFCEKEKDKRYSSKQMPGATTSNPFASVPQINTPNSRPITAPTIKPNNPSQCANTAITKDIARPKTSSSSRTSSSSCQSSSLATPNTLLTSSISSSPVFGSSSISSLSDWVKDDQDGQIALRGSAGFRYLELVDATHNFNERNKLGEGAFGTVYYGVLRQMKCAVKKLSEASDGDSGEKAMQIKRELTSLQKYRQENILTLYGYALDGPSLCLVYQYMPNGSLEDRLRCKNRTAPLTWVQRLNIMVGACQGLNFLHTIDEKPLIHGDIKSANILLDKHMEAKIGDLGQAQQANGGSSSQQLTHITRAQATTKLYGTKAYQSPEVLSGGAQSTKGDIFGMGVVLLEVFSGQQSFDEQRKGQNRFLASYFQELTEAEYLETMDRRAGDCPEDVAQRMLNLALKCTHERKRDRPDSTKLLLDMTAIDDLYKSRLGIRAARAESLPGSEHSCHVSHTSSPDARMYLTAAPQLSQLNDNLCSSVTVPESHLTTDDNILWHNRVARQMQKSSNHGHDCIDNRLNINLSDLPTCFDQNAFLISTKQGTTSPQGSSLGSFRSPIELFQRDEDLPPAYRLQQEYDRQNSGQSSKRPISRLSSCSPKRECSDKSKVEEPEGFPKSDPAKLAKLDHFDNQNLGEGSDPQDLRSDPKKLAALKQFDNQFNPSPNLPVRLVNMPCQDTIVSHQDTESVDTNLACDPNKLAYLKNFDQRNIPTVESHALQETGDSDLQATLTSDPHKLDYLSNFDQANLDRNEHSSAHSQPSSGRVETGQCGSLKPVSEAHINNVVYLQNEALKACHASHFQHNQPLQSKLSAVENTSETHSVAVSVHGKSNVCVDTTPVPAAHNSASDDTSCADPTLLLRRRNFFEEYEAQKNDCDGDSNGVEDDYDNDADENDEESESDGTDVQESGNELETVPKINESCHLYQTEKRLNGLHIASTCETTAEKRLE